MVFGRAVIEMVLWRKHVSVVCSWLFKEAAPDFYQPFRIPVTKLRTNAKGRVTTVGPSSSDVTTDEVKGAESDGRGHNVLVSSGQKSFKDVREVEKKPLNFKLYNTVLQEEGRQERYQTYASCRVFQQSEKEEFSKNVNNLAELSVAARYLIEDSLNSTKASDHERVASATLEHKLQDTELNTDKSEPPLQYPFAIHHPSNADLSRIHQTQSLPYNAVSTGRRQITEIALSQKAEDRLEGLASSLKQIGEKDERRQLDLLDDDEKDKFEEDVFQKSRYGYPDPSVAPSTVECCGCGARLHCQNTGMPGYIPSELLIGATKGQLRSLVCQRCHFLKEHDVALNVSVGSDEYPKLLNKIKKEVALVVLVVDLLDFPCSIWPGLVDIIGRNRPICVVGNKVDLIPRDEKGHLRRVHLSLGNALKERGLDTGKNIKHLCLVSAKSGYGIEELITSIQSMWGTKGDIYLVGCTNVGKSTLFNVLLQSDLCKSQAVDIIQRATTSVWPGTTLNLLKFPLLRPSPHRVRLRMLRLKEEHKRRRDEIQYQQDMLRQTKDPQYASLISHVGLTFFKPPTMFARKLDDGFSLAVKPNPSPVPEGGKVFNPKDKEFVGGHWCCDTPGSVYKDQIINLLTLEELNIILPKELIRPKTFAVQPEFSFFLAGLGRIDYTEGNSTVRFTVFSASSLPVSILPTVNADEFYQKYFGTHVLKVPFGSAKRLQEFPALVEKEVHCTGLDREQSCADIVLSSAGWVAVTVNKGMCIKLKAFTPAGHGCHIRQPAILPYAVRLRGKRLKNTPCYENNKLVSNF